MFSTKNSTPANQELIFLSNKITCEQDLRAKIKTWLNNISIYRIEILENLLKSLDINFPVYFEEINGNHQYSDIISFFIKNNLTLPLSNHCNKEDIILFTCKDASNKSYIVYLHPISFSKKTAKISIESKDKLLTFSYESKNSEFELTQERFKRGSNTIFRMINGNSRILNITFNEGDSLSVMFNSSDFVLTNYDIVENYIISIKKPIILTEIFKQVLSIMELSAEDIANIDEIVFCHYDQYAKPLNSIFLLNGNIKEFGIYKNEAYFQSNEKGKCLYSYKGNSIEYNIEEDNGKIFFQTLDSSFVSNVPNIMIEIVEVTKWLKKLFENPFNPIDFLSE